MLHPTHRFSLRRLASRQDGAVAILSAASIAVAGGLAAFAVDLGSINLAKRRAQQTADLAAMAGAADIARARDVAARSVRENGIETADRVAVSTGIYSPDPAIARPARFVVAGGAAANAVRVEIDTRARLYFGRLLGSGPDAPVSVSATAAVARHGAFSIGSRLLRLDGGVLNGLLSALTGSTVSLSVMDYQALADARIDLFETLQGVRPTGIDLTAGTYRDILRPRIRSADLARAAARATGDGRARAALQSIAVQAGGAAAEASLDRLLDLGPYATTPLSERPAATVAVSALDLLMAHAQVANGNRVVDANLGVSLPGIASARLSLAIGERPQTARWLTIGAEGASVHTAQTRLLLDVRLLGGGLLGAAQVRLPIYIELAPADARLSRIVCGWQRSDLRVAVDARPGLLDAWIGDVTPALMANFTRPVSPPPAEIVRLPLVRVTGQAHAAIRNTGYTPLEFRIEDIERRSPRTVRTTQFTTSLTASLLRDLSLKPDVVGIPLLDVGLVTSAVSGVVTAATPALDQLLASVLQTLGIGLGEADVWVLSARCDGAVLVQ